MATIAPTTTITEIAPGNYQYTHTWANMMLGDVGAPIGFDIIPGSQISVNTTGTLGANGSVAIENSLDGQTNYTPSVIPIVGDILAPLIPPMNWPRFVRPHVVAGDNTTDITTILVCNRTYK
jgi:hypothetical protein